MLFSFHTFTAIKSLKNNLKGLNFLMYGENTKTIAIPIYKVYTTVPCDIYYIVHAVEARLGGLAPTRPTNFIYN